MKFEEKGKARLPYVPLCLVVAGTGGWIGPTKGDILSDIGCDCHGLSVTENGKDKKGRKG